MFTTIRLPRPLATRTKEKSDRPVAQGLAGWLLRWWQAECRRAERPTRSVPYY